MPDAVVVRTDSRGQLYLPGAVIIKVVSVGQMHVAGFVDTVSVTML